jgi:hypothetical protein
MFLQIVRLDSPRLCRGFIEFVAVQQPPAEPGADSAILARMTSCLLTAALVFVFAQAAHAAAPAIELELVTERGVQITAPQEWTQLLAGIGIEHVRIRGIQPGDEPKIDTTGTKREASYHVIGVLTSHNQLRLPGGTFSRSDRGRLKDYFAHLASNGADAVAAPRLRFGLTEKELTTVLADLAQPVEFETKGQAPRAVLDKLQTKLSLKYSLDANASDALQSGPAMQDELRGLSAGTLAAITLRSANLVFRPEESRGRPVAYRVVPLSRDALAKSTLGHTNAKDIQYWPIGWEPDRSPGATAPSLMESLNAEVAGYTMAEAIDAIRPRVKAPILFDRAALKARDIDLTKIQVKLARAKTSYKRLIDRIVSQARLGSDIRVDEAGTPFVWITR